jgi:hypothetical protein
VETILEIGSDKNIATMVLIGIALSVPVMVAFALNMPGHRSLFGLSMALVQAIAGGGLVRTLAPIPAPTVFAVLFMVYSAFIVALMMANLLIIMGIIKPIRIHLGKENSESKNSR